MKTFADLVEPMILLKETDDFSAPARQQQEAAQAFPALVLESGLNLWACDQQHALNTKRLVIGFATSSRPDMELLDELSPWASPLERSGVRGEVFDMYGFENLQEFDQRIQGLAMVCHSPVAGICEIGIWKQYASNFAARQLIANYMRQQIEDSLARLLDSVPGQDHAGIARR